jgi:hypothetical protein
MKLRGFYWRPELRRKGVGRLFGVPMFGVPMLGVPSFPVPGMFGKRDVSAEASTADHQPIRFEKSEKLDRAARRVHENLIHAGRIPQAELHARLVARQIAVGGANVRAIRRVPTRRS